MSCNSSILLKSIQKSLSLCIEETIVLWPFKFSYLTNGPSLLEDGPAVYQTRNEFEQFDMLKSVEKVIF